MNCRQPIIYIEGTPVLAPDEFTDQDKISIQLSNRAQESLLHQLAWALKRALPICDLSTANPSAGDEARITTPTNRNTIVEIYQGSTISLVEIESEDSL